MSDSIDRQKAIDTVHRMREICDTGDIDDLEEMIVTALEELCLAQPERETAKFIRWMECKKTANYISYTPHCKCSKCGTEFLIRTIKYCYVCGAKMEDSEE